RGVEAAGEYAVAAAPGRHESAVGRAHQGGTALLVLRAEAELAAQPVAGRVEALGQGHPFEALLAQALPGDHETALRIADHRRKELQAGRVGVHAELGADADAA